MKAFLSALAFFCLALVATGLLFQYGIVYTATDAYSLDSARPGSSDAEERPGWGVAD
jgi:hypothetical protein